MATLPPSIVTWQRLVPISRSADFATAVAAEIHDPLWMLSRQHRIGELTAQDAGSPAFVRVGYQPAPLTNLMLTSGTGQTTTLPVDASKPIEAQMLSEPQTPELATRVELGLTFLQILGEAFPPSGTGPSPVVAAFAGAKSLALTPPDGTIAPFDPIDQSTATFVSMTGSAVDGVAVYGLAQSQTIPSDVTTLTADQKKVVLNVYKGFVTWVQATFGQLDTAASGTDPQGWNAKLLDYDVQMQFGTTNVVTMNVEPNENGAVDWTSFDFVSQSVANSDPFSGITAQVTRVAPMTVRFPGMPSPRYWDFESGELPWPDVDATRIELLRLLIIDFAMLYGVDWFILPLDLPVANAVKIASLLVFDVFGGLTVVDPVEAARNVTAPAVPDRFTMYSTASPGGNVAGFMVLPPAAGTALQQGTVLEEVRFARDEMADMVWGIEAVTESRIGERRRGTERDAAVDAAGPAPSTPTNTAALSYQLESKIPVQWIPFLTPDTGTPSTVFVEGETERDVVQGNQVVPTPVPPAGKILKPTGLFKDSGGPGYNVFQEQIPRSGAKVQRVQFAARALDGKSYFWIARRRRAGAGETQSGLRFDAPLPTQPPTP